MVYDYPLNLKLQVLKDYYHNNYSIREIAEKYNIGRGAVHMWISGKNTKTKPYVLEYKRELLQNELEFSLFQVYLCYCKKYKNTELADINSSLKLEIERIFTESISPSLENFIRNGKLKKTSLENKVYNICFDYCKANLYLDTNQIIEKIFSDFENIIEESYYPSAITGIDFFNCYQPTKKVVSE